MNRCVLLLLACWPAVVGAATIGELIKLSLARDGAVVEQVLDGPQMAGLRARLRGATLYGRVSKLRALEQEGCARYALRLRAGTTELATVSLDLCEDGSPPVPTRP